MTSAPDPQQALLAHLRHRADCYGADFCLPVAPPAAADATAAGTAAAAAATETGAETRAAPAVALAALAQEAATCTRCRLHEGRTNLVFGEGSACARVMFVGEAPGQVEDETGRPFVGPSGKLLTKIIEGAMGMTREEVYIANINKCRPPGNRDPQADEIALCLTWLRAQIQIIKPEVIITLGRVALSNLLAVSLPMRLARGRDLQYEGTPVVATWHPAYLLRTPSAKAQTWEDIKRVNRMLGRPEVPGQRRPGG